MEDLFNTLAFEEAARALRRLKKVPPVKTTPLEEVRMMMTCLGTLGVYRLHLEQGEWDDKDVACGCADQGTEEVARVFKMPLTPDATARKKMRLIIVHMLERFRNKWLNSQRYTINPSIN